MKKRPAADAPPPSTTFQLLWGTRDKAARGPRPAFRLEQVVKAGVEIADAGGLSALTMAAVAERLDVTAMALYRYVPSKDALIDLVADAVLARPPKPAGASWRADISAWGRADLARLRRHPWLLDIVSTRTEVGPNWARWLDAGLQCLEPLPFSVSEKMAAFLLVDGHLPRRRTAPRRREVVAGVGEWLQSHAAVRGRPSALPGAQRVDGWRDIKGVRPEPPRDDRLRFRASPRRH
jgi:AcrR family transcriptional regulator